jgi:hypothetical protein
MAVELISAFERLYNIRDEGSKGVSVIDTPSGEAHLVRAVRAGEPYMVTVFLQRLKPESSWMLGGARVGSYEIDGFGHIRIGLISGTTDYPQSTVPLEGIFPWLRRKEEIDLVKHTLTSS